MSILGGSVTIVEFITSLATRLENSAPGFDPSSLTSLSLSHNNISSDTLDTLCEGLFYAYSLRHLDLSFNLFGDSQCLLLAKLLKINQGLYTIILSGNIFSDLAISNIFAALVYNKSLVTFDIRLCALTHIRIQILSTLIIKVPHIEVCLYYS